MQIRSCLPIINDIPRGSTWMQSFLYFQSQSMRWSNSIVDLVGFMTWIGFPSRKFYFIFQLLATTFGTSVYACLWMVIMPVFMSTVFQEHRLFIFEMNGLSIYFDQFLITPFAILPLLTVYLEWIGSKCFVQLKRHSFLLMLWYIFTFPVSILLNVLVTLYGFVVLFYQGYLSRHVTHMDPM